MTDRFDEAKRALEGVPAPDVWAEAQRRAEDGAPLVPLTPALGRVRRPARWLAAAAAVVVAVGTVAVLATDGEAPLDTGQGSDSAVDPEEEVTVYQADGACKLGIRGEPLPEPTPVKPVEAHAGSTGTSVQGSLNAQFYVVQVPGEVVIDLVGERVEDVQLRRGTAAIWFMSTGAVQVRWFTGSQEPCDSFTVTMDGGTEDENRHAAVDLAERVVLPSELPQDPPPDVSGLAGTEWFLQRSVAASETIDSDGSLLFTFTATEARWSDGCNRKSATYTYADEILRLHDISTTDVFCEPTPTSDVINAVMVEGGIAAIVTGHRLTLRTLDGELTLAQAGRSVAVPGEPYGIWPMTAPEEILGYAPEVTGTARDIAVAFADHVLGWSDAIIIDSEPSEDGHSGSVFLIASARTGGEVEIRVRAGDGPDRHVVYSVNTPDRLADPEATAGISVHGSVAQANVSALPPGTSATARFIYGENSVEGPLGEELELTWVDQVPGAVLVLFEDGAGNVVGAWGTPLPAGDFAAS